VNTGGFGATVLDLCVVTTWSGRQENPARQVRLRRLAAQGSGSSPCLIAWLNDMNNDLRKR
jgi:hypothetical protein